MGRPKRRCLDVMKEDMQEVEVREDEVFNHIFLESAVANPDGKGRQKKCCRCIHLRNI